MDSLKHHPAGFLRREHERQLDGLPRRFLPVISKRWDALYRKHGRLYEPNRMLLEVGEALGGFRFNVAAGEDDLRAFAKARADECFRAAARYVDEDLALSAMEEIAKRNGIEPPAGPNVTKQGRRARLLCEKWWRRNLRRYVGRGVEKAAITLGLVHRKAGLYASDETVTQRIGQKARNRALLESITAVNERGDEYTLQELSDLGTSNQEIRRGELMTRLAGFDQIAKKLGHAAQFITWTLPSKYHARDSVTGAENPKYNGSTPKESQAVISGNWAKARAALHRRGIRIYGFRVCEPHHDGTPHWHMVLFMQPEHVQTVLEVMRGYAYSEDANEPGAAKHRFTAKEIDRSRGNAAGYLAKYIAKNIDGYNVGEDWEAEGGKDDAKESAARVDAWASRWGIRQFQQVGGAPVSVWRELRRLKVEDAGNWAVLEALIYAADKGGKVEEGGDYSGWALYVNLMGGVFASRKDHPARCYRVGGVDAVTGEIKFNVYGEIAAPIIKGLECWGAGIVETRIHEWKFERRGGNGSNGKSRGGARHVETVRVGGKDTGEAEKDVRGNLSVDFQRDGFAVAPWSSVNNCTGGGAKIPTWSDCPAWIQRVRAGLIFDGRGFEWMETQKSGSRYTKRQPEYKNGPVMLSSLQLRGCCQGG